MSAHGPVAPLGVASVSTPVAPLEPVLPLGQLGTVICAVPVLPATRMPGELRRDAGAVAVADHGDHHLAERSRHRRGDDPGKPRPLDEPEGRHRLEPPSATVAAILSIWSGEARSWYWPIAEEPSSTG